MKFNLILLLLIFSIGVCNGQDGAFHRVAKPIQNKQHSLFSTSGIVKKEFRFTGPTGGYLYPQNKLVAGLGYGWQRMHFVDSTQKWYTDFSINAVGFASGNVTPTLHPNNIVTAALELGVLNQLILIGPAWNFKQGSAKGSIGLVLNISIPLNN